MKSKKTTRRALLTSMLSLLLCVSMLVGSTFAWFTDSVTSKNNIIQSGNLDVVLEYWNEDEGKYVEVTSQTELFNSAALWEPGYTEVAYLKVSNAGTLALKYQLGVNVIKETLGKTKTGEDIKLSDHLVFSVVEKQINSDNDLYTRETAKAAAGTEKGLKTYNSGTKTLEKTGAAHYVALIIYMPESVGNEANHDGKNVPSIEMGVNLVATQKDAEEDSFGKDYDEDAWGEGFKVYNANDLQTAIDAGETNIVLMDDIDLTEAIVIPAPATSTYSLRAASNAIVINLNGKTINNSNGYVIENQGNLVITGNGTISGLGCIRSKAGSITIENGNFFASSRWQDSVYQHTLKAENTVVEINGGNFDATVKGHTNAVFNASENGVITINGGTFKNVDGALANFDPYLFTYEKNGKVIINDGTFFGGWRFNGETATTDINGGNFTVGFDGQSFHANSTHVLTVYGGTFTPNAAYPNNSLAGKLDSVIAEGYKAVETSDGWMVIPESTNYVTNSEELVKAIKETADGGTILMAAGEFAVRFTNDTTFNADNLTFKGMEGTKLSVSSSEVWYGRVQGDNVVFENIEFTSSVGATGKATYNNCTFSGDWTICASGSNAETYINNCTINGCLNTSVDFSSGDAYVKDSTIAKAEYSGSATMNFENCKIGELIVWNMNTNLVNTTVETMDLSHVTTAVIMIDGYKYLADGLGVDSNGVYGVSSAKGLVALNAMMAEKKAGKGFKVELLADIDMTGEVWTTVNSHVDSGCYISEFDGNGHTISNLTINGQAMFSRFAGSGDVVIKDVTFDKANVNSNGNINTSILTVQSYQNVLLDNVDVTNSTITGGYKVAPLIGSVYNESSTSITATLKNCDVSNTTVTATVYDFCTTGMVAFVYEGDNDKVVFENCTVSKVTLVAPDDSYKAHAWIYVNDADTDDKFNEAVGVTVTDCVFQNP